jgi:hypothetical protein
MFLPLIFSSGIKQTLLFSLMLKAFKSLFSQSINSKISHVWKSCVDMTIYSRALHRSSLNKVFGTKIFPLEYIEDNLQIFISPSKDYNVVNLSVGVLFISSENQIAYDSFILLKSMHIYTQKKINLSPKHSVSFIRAKAIRNIVLQDIEHFGCNHVLGNIHIIFYEWGSTTEVVVVDEEEKEEEDHIKLVDEISNELTAMGNISVEVEIFIKEFPKNIHFVTRSEISNWILPSFLPVAHLATSNSFSVKM